MEISFKQLCDPVRDLMYATGTKEAETYETLMQSYHPENLIPADGIADYAKIILPSGRPALSQEVINALQPMGQSISSAEDRRFMWFDYVQNHLKKSQNGFPNEGRYFVMYSGAAGPNMYNIAGQYINERNNSLPLYQRDVAKNMEGYNEGSPLWFQTVRLEVNFLFSSLAVMDLTASTKNSGFIYNIDPGDYDIYSRYAHADPALALVHQRTVATMKKLDLLPENAQPFYKPRSTLLVSSYVSAEVALERLIAEAQKTNDWHHAKGFVASIRRASKLADDLLTGNQKLPDRWVVVNSENKRIMLDLYPAMGETITKEQRKELEKFTRQHKELEGSTPGSTKLPSEVLADLKATNQANGRITIANALGGGHEPR